MKTCPTCSEETRDSAIECENCGDVFVFEDLEGDIWITIVPEDEQEPDPGPNARL